MSNGFYDFIAKSIISYFQKQINTLRFGERYCLKLDTEEMVKGVDDALREISLLEEIQGEYSHGDVYQTFTLKLSNDMEIVVASKINGMTDDYLATLRNAELSSKKLPILMITSSTIDSISSGTGDLSAVGMPFHSSTIIDGIKESIKSAQLSPFDQTLLENELKIKQSDKYSDKSSLFEYKDLLTVLGRGNLELIDFINFSMLPDPDICAWTDTEKINNRINENRELFEKIDKVYKYGNVKEALSKEFDKSLVDEIDSKKKKNIPWHEDLTFTIVKTSKEKYKIKTDHPLVIENSDIEIFSGTPLEYSFVENESYFIRAEGESKSQQRKKNIIIYNVDNKDSITIEIATNIYIKPSCVEASGLTIETSARKVSLGIHPSGCSFGFANLMDQTNKIKYEFKICVLNIQSDYLDSVRTAYSLFISKRNLCKSKIQVFGLSGELVINPNKEIITEEKATQGSTFNCSYNQTLVLEIDPGFNVSDNGKLDFDVQIGSVVVPVQIKDDPIKPVLLTGPSLFKKKHSIRKSLEYRGGKILIGTEEYYVADQFRKNLENEDLFVKNCWLAITDDFNGLVEYPLSVSEPVRAAYCSFVSLLSHNKTLPSLTYYSDDILLAAERYVKAVELELNAISSGQCLSQSQNDLLLLGCIIRRTEEQVIEMSPLHPLNVLYQLELINERSVGEVRDALVEKLSPLYLLPYFKNNKKELYRAVEQKHSPEWRYYAPFSDARYHATRNFVQKLVCEKIIAYRDYFSFLFEDIGNTQVCINLVNMGDCREVFQGIIRFYLKELAEKDTDHLYSFVINIYSDDEIANEFSLLSNQKKLKCYLKDNFSKEIEDINEIEQVLIKNTRCFFRNPSEEVYQYAHITFYEMPLSKDDGSGQSFTMNSGISLNGMVSGMPSVLNSSWYKTGFGMKYAEKNRLTTFANILNSMVRVAFSGSSYEPNQCIFTEIEKGQEAQQGKIYDSSNWVVFVDPKVDLSFFQKKSSDDNELMIIHYSDQCTTSNGYDDITVTSKSDQYNEIICEQLEKKGVEATHNDIDNIISLFNAINGSWMLRLITAKKLNGAVDSFFSREKMSILSAIKLCMAYYAHPDIVWVPISLEEMLRVSGGAGYSQKDGLLSARNLGFETRATSDDILLVGIEGPVDDIKVYIHPVEVKIGTNPQNYIEKARAQALNTFSGLWNALWPDEDRDKLETRLSRNFFMQLVIVCCEKMKLYKVYPNENWDLVLDVYRNSLLNDKYSFSHKLDNYIGKGTVVSFKADTLVQSGVINDGICYLEFPEKKGSSYMVWSTDQIEKELNQSKSDLPSRLIWIYSNDGAETRNVSENNNGSDFGSETNIVGSSKFGSVQVDSIYLNDSGYVNNAVIEEPVEGEVKNNCTEETCGMQESEVDEITTPTQLGMNIIFGTNKSNGSILEWHPNDTNQLFHTNTGIIGQMGTGKTQFTKSLITQIYRERQYNIDNPNLGILIFDYKGDYNESKEDFIRATNAKVLKPYHLPFNPLSLIESKVYKPLLPIHTANAFKDTLAKIYQLGPKQQNSLFQCILNAYEQFGIRANDRDSWKKTVPTFEHVYQQYISDEEIKKTDSLAAAMDKLHQFELFESDPSKTISLFELLSGVVVIDINGYDDDIQNLIIAITLDLFYSQMQSSGSSRLEGQYRQLTKLILVDEADNFMKEGFPALKKILKEGREFGVGTILSTQFLTHFGSGEDDYSKYILTWVVHNVADLRPADVDFVFKTEPKSQESNRLFNSIKSLEKHNSIVMIGNNRPIFIEDKPFYKLIQEK